MAFKLTYSDGQESSHDDDTVWEVDSGVLKLGRTEGKWSVLLSPSHWAVLEVDGAKSPDDGDGDGDGDSKGKGEDEDQDDSEKDSADAGSTKDD